MIADLTKFEFGDQDGRVGMHWKENETKIKWNLPSKYNSQLRTNINFLQLVIIGLFNDVLFLNSLCIDQL